MRVIGGIHRSRRLEQVPGEATRETKDRVKEAIFNRVASYLPDAHVLDLFAGSGSLGIEALSRGARDATFIDIDKRAVAVIDRNIKALDLNARAKVLDLDWDTYLAIAIEPFDVILLDPPYALGVLDSVVTVIARNELLAPGGVIVCLHDRNGVPQPTNHGIVIDKTKAYGKTAVTYMKWGE